MEVGHLEIITSPHGKFPHAAPRLTDPALFFPNVPSNSNLLQPRCPRNTILKRTPAQVTSLPSIGDKGGDRGFAAIISRLHPLRIGVQSHLAPWTVRTRPIVSDSRSRGIGNRYFATMCQNGSFCQCQPLSI